MLRQCLKFLQNQRGVGTEEVILGSAMLLSLGAFAAVNVPWSTIFGTPSQMVEDISVIETANAEFFERHRLWPHETTDGAWEKNAAALASTDVMRYPFNAMESFRNLVPGLDMAKESKRLRHGYGEGGDILQRPVTFKGTEYLEVIYKDVPVDAARKVDVKMDGAYDPDGGRVFLVFNEDNQDKVDLHYRANQLQVGGLASR